jgi:glycosyltransferase involved in cell wall biosynthesis
MTQPQPIVLVEFSPSGGLFQFAVQLGEALAAAGHRVVLLTGPEPELAPTQDGFEIKPVLPTWHPADSAPRSRAFRLIRRGMRAVQLVLAWLVLAWHLLRIRPRAVLWSHWRFSFEPGFVVLLSALLRGPLLGLVAHEPVPRSDAKDTSTHKDGTLLNAAFGAAWRRLDVAFTLGPQTRDLAMRHWQPSCEVVVIPHGDERALAAPGRAGRPMSQTEPVALFFGTWSTYKGIEVLMEAFALVRVAMPEAKLVVAGAVGADVDLPTLLARAELIGNIDARPGYVAVADIQETVEAARVVVTPYIRATQSGVAHLAYTFGRPVIATAIGDLPEVVQNGRTGLLVAPGDAQELAAAMLKLLADSELADQLGAAGKQSVAEAWSVAAERVGAALDRAGRRD